MLCIAATIAYISRSCISVPAEIIRAELDISLDEMGWVMSAFFWSYAIAQIPSGWLGHVWGSRKALTLYALTWSLATGLGGLSVGLASLVAARLGFGLAQAGIFPCSADIVSKWMPESRRGFSTGALGAFMSIGGAIGVALTGLLLSGIDWTWLRIPAMTWREIFILFALPGIIWAIWFFIRFQDHPNLQIANRKATIDNPIPWPRILRNPSMWMICGQQFFRAAGYIFFVTWFPTYLQKVHDVEVARSGFLTSLPLLCVVAGSLLGGGVVDWIWNRTGSRRLSRQGVAIVAMLGSALCTLAAYFAINPLVAVAVLSAGSFSAGLGGSCGYTVTIDKAGQQVAPIFGMMNMSGNFGAALCPIVIGKLFNLGHFHSALILVAAIYLAAAACWAFLDPNGKL